MPIEHICAQYTDQELAALQSIVSQATICIEESALTIYSPCVPDHRDEARILRQTLHVLNSAAQIRRAESFHCDIRLFNWLLAPELVSELRALPELTGPASLAFEVCSWVQNESCTQLPATVPRCYSTWYISSNLKPEMPTTLQHYMSICQGAQARGEGCGKLLLQTFYRPSADEQAQVAACIEQGGLGQWVEVQWGFLADWDT